MNLVVNKFLENELKEGRSLNGVQIAELHNKIKRQFILRIKNYSFESEMKIDGIDLKNDNIIYINKIKNSSSRNLFRIIDGTTAFVKEIDDIVYVTYQLKGGE